jgi:hypothetical protein
MAVAKLDLRDIDFDTDGHLNAGGKIYTYQASTTTPLATYADNTGGVANPNPLVLDSSGQGHVWLTIGVSYKFVYTTADDATIYTENGVIAADPSAGSTSSLFADVVVFYAAGPPTTSELIYLERVLHAISFAAAFTGSYGKAITAPTASFVISVRKNATTSSTGTEIGTITVATDGSYTFATTGGATQSLAVGDTISFWGPSSADTTIANFGFTLAGTLA